MNNDLINLISLDIETTGLDPKKDKIWSIGVSGPNSGSEYFSNPTSQKTASGTILEMSKMNEFGQSQMDRGVFSDLGRSIDAGSTTSPQRAIGEALSMLPQGGALVMQNHNFENRFIGEVLLGMPEKESQAILDKMMYKSESFDGRILYTPPQITSLRQEARQELYSFNRTNSSRSLDRVDQIYKEMMSEYDRHLNMKNKGIFTIELMDVTKATFASLAKEGYMNSKMINVGSNVEFLSSTVLGEKEIHSALSDADQQRRIYLKLREIQEQVTTGNLSKENRSIVRNITSSQSLELDKQFISAVRSGLGEIKENGKTILLGNFTRDLNIGVLDSDNRIYHVSAVDNSKQEYTKDIRRLFYHTQDRYTGIPVSSNTIGKLRGIVENNSDIDVAISSVNDLLDESKLNVSERLKSYHVSQEGHNVGTPSEPLDLGLEKNIRKGSIIFDNFKANATSFLSKNKKSLTVGSIAAGLLYMANKDTEYRKEDSERQRRESLSVNNRLRMFEEPTVYHGTGLANFNERVRSHEY